MYITDRLADFFTVNWEDMPPSERKAWIWGRTIFGSVCVICLTVSVLFLADIVEEGINPDEHTKRQWMMKKLEMEEEQKEYRRKKEKQERYMKCLDQHPDGWGGSPCTKIFDDK